MLKNVKTTKNHYINNNILVKEIIISKGKGRRSAKLDEMFIKIADGIYHKLSRSYDNKDDAHDIYVHVLCTLFSNYKNFNEKKYDDGFSYFSEITKRAFAEGFNLIVLRKKYSDDEYHQCIRLDDIIRKV